MFYNNTQQKRPNGHRRSPGTGPFVEKKRASVATRSFSSLHPKKNVFLGGKISPELGNLRQKAL